MAAIVFDPVAGTSLYQPAAPSGDERLLYLATGTPSSDPITLDQAWTGKARGCFLFVDRLPTAAEYPAFQKAVDEWLSTSPSRSGFAWLGWDGTTVSPFLQVPVGAGETPVTNAQVLLATPGI